MQIGQRVSTQFGAGTVAGFERSIINAPTAHPAEYGPGDRIEVALDDPARWVIRNGGNPYFYAEEIKHQQPTKE